VPVGVPDEPVTVALTLAAVHEGVVVVTVTVGVAVAIVNGSAEPAVIGV